MRVTYPSEDFPAPPGFVIEVPGEWTGQADPFADMVLAAPTPTEGVHENVIVKYRRVDPSTDGTVVLDAMLDAVTAKDDTEVRHVDKRATSGGLLARIVTTRTIETSDILQDHALFHLLRGRSGFVLSITATASNSEAGADRARALVESLRIEPASADGE